MPRKRKTEANKESAGSFTVHPGRKMNNPVAAKRTRRPAAPKELKGDRVATAKWKHLCECLDELGQLAVTDQDIMVIYCRTWSQWMHAQQMEIEQGSVIQVEKQGARRNPYSVIVKESAAFLYKLGNDMGLSPQARTRLVTMPKLEDDPAEEFKNRKLKVVG